MDCALRKACQQLVAPPDRLTDGLIVREHRDRHLAATGAGNVRGFARPELDQRLVLGGTAVVDRDFVSSLDEIGRHGRPHLTQADESDVHLTSFGFGGEPCRVSEYSAMSGGRMK